MDGGYYRYGQIEMDFLIRSSQKSRTEGVSSLAVKYVIKEEKNNNQKIVNRMGKDQIPNRVTECVPIERRRRRECSGEKCMKTS